jgi:hypothetical protein
MRAWKGLGERQKYVISFAASWFTIYVLDKGADAVFGAVPASPVLAVVKPILRDYVLDRFVAGLVVGALVIGFWGNIISFIRKLGAIVPRGGISAEDKQALDALLAHQEQLANKTGKAAAQVRALQINLTKILDAKDGK